MKLYAAKKEDKVNKVTENKASKAKTTEAKLKAKIEVKPKKHVESGAKKLIGRGKEILKTDGVKKGGKIGLIGLSVVGLGAAADKVGRKIKEKKKENEMRKKILGDL